MAENNLMYWGKTFPPKDSDGATAAPENCKPVLHHLLDVAAVTISYLEAQSARTTREANALGLSVASYVRLAAFFAASHDLGKFASAFQMKSRMCWPAALLGPYPENSPESWNHWRLTAVLLRAAPIAEKIAPLLPNTKDDAFSPLIAAIAGHHGRPPEGKETSAASNAATSRFSFGPAIGDPGLAAATEAVEVLLATLGPEPALLSERHLRHWSWRLSGLITLCDWVGSDNAFFGPSSPHTPLDAYWRQARKQAAKALKSKGLLPATPQSAPSLATISPTAAKSPRPMQHAAQNTELHEGPQLFIIEDTTGSGKTEAALLLAARLIAAGSAEGLYIGLPTMATANAMFGRLSPLARRLFKDCDATPASLVLAHGKSALAGRLAALAGRVSGADASESTAAYCNTWIADNRRKAFFAEIGAGTIDQAFLAVLPKRHLTLRQHALAGRVLLVDEAHSFDPYMGEELKALLQLQAMNGGSAIILSATLSNARRQDMVSAFEAGLTGLPPIPAKGLDDQPAPYPLLTHISASRSRKTPVPFDSRFSRTIAVERLENRTEAVTAARNAAESEAAVLVICNAVDEAIATFDRLAEGGIAPDRLHLFHARFAFGDRQAIEQAVLDRFGAKARSENRAGHILVATQVVEQSLDLDFDLVITDLAPIDLLIQRAGRLWRHMDRRPAGTRPVPGPRLLVVSPDPEKIAGPDWLGPTLGKAASIYGHADTMWHSAHILFASGKIQIPSDLRAMIEAVYGPEHTEVPAELLQEELKDKGTQGSAKTLGKLNAIDVDKGYSGLPSNLSADQDIGTRLGEPTLTIRLARQEKDRLLPWTYVDGGDLNLDWALSEISVRQKFWGNTTPLETPLHHAARADWPDWEKEIKLVEVAPDGQLLAAGEAFSYSTERGLQKVVP